MADSTTKMTPGKQAAMEAYWQDLIKSMVAEYCGPGKRFKDEKEFKDYIGGVGRGFVNAFGQSATNDHDGKIAFAASLGATIYTSGSETEKATWYDSLIAEKQNSNWGVVGLPEFKSYVSKYVDDAPTADDTAAQNQAAYDVERQKVIAKVQAFADEMNMPIDKLMQVDDFAKALRNSTYGGQLASASDRGFGLGGMSQANADLSTKQALLGYQAQRQNAGQGALGQAYNMLSGMAGEAEQTRQYEQGLNLQLQQAAAMAQAQAQAQKQQMYSAALGTVGGIVGGLASSYGGGSYATGAQIGGSLGQMGGSALAQQGYQPYQYSYPKVGGRGSGGLSGGTKTAGNY